MQNEKVSKMMARYYTETVEPMQRYHIVKVADSSLYKAIKILASEVNEMCQNGWEREGGIIISPLKYNSKQCVVAHAVRKKRGIEVTENIPQYDIVVESVDAIDKAIDVLEKDINSRCQEGWEREGEIVIAPIMDANKYVVLHAMTKK